MSIWIYTNKYVLIYTNIKVGIMGPIVASRYIYLYTYRDINIDMKMYIYIYRYDAYWNSNEEVR